MPVLHAGVGGPNWFDWSVHWDTILLCAVLLYGYYYAATKLRPRISDAGRVKRSQIVLFSLGVLALYIGGGTAIHDLGEEYLFTAHTVQHLLFALAAAPLLLAGTPPRLWEWFVRPRPVMAVARVITKPVVAFTLFNALLVLIHLLISQEIRISTTTTPGSQTPLPHFLTPTWRIRTRGSRSSASISVNSPSSG